MYDIVIIGASFAGLTLAHHLPKNLKILILDKKTTISSFIESTGLITEETRRLFAGFTDIDRFIPNQITDIAVISPDYNKYFISATAEPWIYSTDTPNLLAHLARTLPDNVEIKTQALFINYKQNPGQDFPLEITYQTNSHQEKVLTKFLVGADGCNSMVAKLNPHLSKNTRFLAGLEKVYYGRINFGANPDATVYHFWFGEFSLGYGGWLSPTIMNDKLAFRVGLAKLDKDIKDLHKLNEFVEILVAKNIVSIEPDSQAIYQFGSQIPINGVLKRIFDQNTLLIGDAAGFCGAFAADGIKGAILSAQIAAELIPQHLKGDSSAFSQYKPKMQKHKKILTYYRKQLFYRFIWNRMKSNRTFLAIYDLIATAQVDFLNQFCDSKDNAKSLTRIIIKPKNIPLLLKYSIYLLIDIFKR